MRRLPLVFGFLILLGAALVGAQLAPDALPDARTSAADIRAPLFRDRRQLRAFAMFSDCEQCPELVVIPGGVFTMGSPVSEVGRWDNEGPQHEVRVEALAVSRFEITFEECAVCAAGGGCASNPDPSDQGWGRGRRPVVNVSWNDAQDYVAWLTRETGHRYRLLSEAEWEYAARAGTTTPFSTGNEISQRQARFDARSTSTVGSYVANPFGLHHMHGNVWEWVEDVWHRDYDEAPNDGRAWVQRGDATYRVHRGGAWLFTARYLRSAKRGAGHPAERNDNHGLRVARALR